MGYVRLVCVWRSDRASIVHWSLVLVNSPATTASYTYCHTLSLHDALPISGASAPCPSRRWPARVTVRPAHPRARRRGAAARRSEEHTSELKSLMRTSYAVFCLKKKQEHIIRYISS